ncbi:MAG: FkbM family methyltransferase [Anaerolineae bacterium]|nr:FkbM family methyltransferase [Anaerolineae bacterium]
MITPLIAKLTRWLQQQTPDRPLPGLYRLSRVLPGYSGSITLANGVRWPIDTALTAHRELLFSGVYQPALVNALRPYAVPGAYCMDVGSNIGFFAMDFAAQVGPEGQVAAFEANPALVERIQTVVEINHYGHVQIIPQAVFHTSGQEVTFYVSKYEGKSSLSADLVTERLSEVTVTTITIDDFIVQQGWQRLDVIKMDIEGADVDALIGAEQSIRRFRPVIAFEFKRGADPDRLAQLQAIFAEAGYTLQVITLGGDRFPFTWDVPEKLDHVDVLCLPESNLPTR